MVEPAAKRMSVAEFLRWEDGTDARYELVGGAPVAMAPPGVAHGRLIARLCGALASPLRCPPPSMAQVMAAIAAPDRDDTCYIADLAVASRPPRPGQQLLSEPLLMIEVLCPGTAIYDRQTKVADYRRIPSVREILLVDSSSVFAEVLKREGDRWVTEVVQGRDAVLTLASNGLTVPMSELYEGIEIQDGSETDLRVTGA